MKQIKISRQSLNEEVQISSFKNDKGTDEHFIVLNINRDLTFSTTLNELNFFYLEALNRIDVSTDDIVFSRVYLSDIENQKEELQESPIFKLLKKGAHSVIGQTPLLGGNASVLVYIIKGAGAKKETKALDEDNWRNLCVIRGENYDHHWNGNYTGLERKNSFEQTEEIFDSYIDYLDTEKLTVLDNCVRTWIYARDIDNNYAGMVESRIEHFNKLGLTADTRYIASTGIEGKLRDVFSLVSMDALSYSNIKQEQIVRMEALEHLCPTHLYNVTFERGTKLVFGDRSHLHISGTASIDKHGDVLYLSDIHMQTERTMENIKALLTPHGADLSDMAYYIVYVRNITAVQKVIEVMHEHIDKDTPILVVQGSVCRPTWLVEIEGVGLTGEGDAKFPDFR